MTHSRGFSKNIPNIYQNEQQGSFSNIFKSVQVLAEVASSRLEGIETQQLHWFEIIWKGHLCTCFDLKFWSLMRTFWGHPICADLFTFQTWWPMQLRQSHAPRTQVWPSISKARSCKINILNYESSVFGSSSMDASLDKLITCQSSFQFSQFSCNTLSIQPYVTSFLMERYLIDVISPVLKTCPCRCHSSFNQVCTPPP